MQGNWVADFDGNTVKPHLIVKQLEGELGSVKIKVLSQAILTLFLMLPQIQNVHPLVSLR